ncbi:glycosyltransferase [Dyella sp. M7H15-1]|uniref:glycosyltransferase family 4 protein n=1 Tax=Dyella sp. M7H15-1 TaxID=2501295 RepID=UPI001005249A|nr:glycosyltransferase family 4 protein [Dyella sp. M7H15-1]QAU24997.1 glycosyltransferase [Dyella sp. M7H15-1]
MKILVVNNMAPFVWGGAEELAVNLQQNLIAAGHESEVLRIPFQWEPASKIPSQMLLARTLEMYNTDRVIALKFPAYLVRHPRKTLWLLHQYRQAYDLYDVGQSNLFGVEGETLRGLIRNADNDAFRESDRIFVNSEVTRNRLRHYNGFDAQVLLPPVNDPERFVGGSGNYIFAGGRVNSMKRQHLLVEAMKYATPDVRLVIGGPPDAPEDAIRLHGLVERLGLKDRVQLDLRFLPREIYANYINGAMAVAYLPYDEDSLGYVAMESATAGKALISTHDSGGILTLARDQQTGRVVAPEAAELGDAISFLWRNREATKAMGQAAKELWLSFGINWRSTVEALLQ